MRSWSLPLIALDSNDNDTILFSLSLNHRWTSMRRRLVLTVALLYLLGTFGAPAVAYSCTESGDSGVVPYLALSLRSSCVDSCCANDQDAPSVRVERGISCCDIDLQTVQPRSRVLLPSRVSGPAETFGDASGRVDAVQASVLLVTAPPATQASQRSINTPLRI